MRFLPLVIATLLATLLAAPAAAFPDPMTVVVYATPEGAGVNETITIHVEVYMHASLVHPDELTGVASAARGQPTVVLDFSNAGIGRFTATLEIRPEFNSGYRSVSIHVTARVADHEETGRLSYHIGEPGYPSGLYIGARVANTEQLGIEPLAGDTIVFQSYTHRDGRPEDVGAPSGRVVLFPYADRFEEYSPFSLSRDEQSVVGVREGPGVHSFTYQIPPETNVSTRFQFNAEIQGTVHQPSAVAHVIVHPLPAILEIVNGAPAGSAARVCASYRGHAVENASVAFGIIPNPTSIISADIPIRENRTTGPDGCATVPLDSEGDPDRILVIANVEGFGLTSRLMVAGAYRDDPFEPQGGPDPPPHDLVLRLLSDPTIIVPGTEATFTISAAVNGTPLANYSVAVFAGPWNRGQPFFIGERPTDANGTFSFTCPIPEAWTWNDLLHVRFVTEAGERLEVHINVGVPPLNHEHWPGHGPPGPLRVEATHDTVNGTLAVRAYPQPGQNVTGLSAWGDVIPVESVFPMPGNTRDGNFPGGPMRWDGEAFSGTFRLSAWLWEGDYVVVAGLESEFGFRTRPAEVPQYNWTTVHLSPPRAEPVDGSLPEPPAALDPADNVVADDPPLDSGLPGASPPALIGDPFPFMWLLLFVAAGTLALLWLRRRPREDN